MPKKILSHRLNSRVLFHKNTAGKGFLRSQNDDHEFVEVNEKQWWKVSTQQNFPLFIAGTFELYYMSVLDLKI